MLSFHMSADLHSEDIRRDGTLIGFLQWHRNNKRITVWQKGGELSLDELKQCVDRLSTKDASPGYNPESELGREVERGSRSARVDMNRVPGEGQYAVFQRTFYMRRWYYDGYAAFDDLDEAIKFRDGWLTGHSYKLEDCLGDPSKSG